MSEGQVLWAGEDQMFSSEGDDTNSVGIGVAKLPFEGVQNKRGILLSQVFAFLSWSYSDRWCLHSPYPHFAV